MDGRISVKVTKNCLKKIARAVGVTVATEPKAAADRIVAGAKPRARVRTGAMKGTTHADGDAGTGTARAPMFYSGFQNYGTSRGIKGDRWFSAPAEAEAARFPRALRDAVRGCAGKC